MALVVLAGDDRAVVALQREGKVYVYDVESDVCVMQIVTGFRVSSMVVGWLRKETGGEMPEEDGVSAMEVEGCGLRPCLFVGGYNGRLAQYDLEGGACVQQYRGHRADVTWVFWVDGILFSASAADRCFREWDTDGSCVTHYRGPDEWLSHAVVAQPGEDVFLVAGTLAGAVYVWVRWSETPVFQLRCHRAYIHCLAMTDVCLFSASNDKMLLKWDLTDGSCVAPLRVGEEPVTTHRMLVHEGFLYTASKDKMIRKWSVDTCELVRQWPGHEKTIYDMCVWGPYLLTSAMDKRAAVFDRETGERIHSFAGLHSRTIKQVTSNGRFVYMASEDATVTKWAMDTGELVVRIDRHESFVPCTLVTDSGLIMMAHDASIFVFEIPYPDPVLRLDAHTEEVLCMALEDTGTSQRLWSAGKDRRVLRWDLDQGVCDLECLGHRRSILTLLVHRGWVFSGSLDKVIMQWDAETGARLAMFAGHQKSVQRMMIANDRLVSGSYDHTLYVWDIERAAPLRHHVRHTKSIKCLLSINGRVFSGSFDHNIIRWSLDSNDPEAIYAGHRKSVVCLAVDPHNPDPEVFFSGSDDATMRMWSIDHHAGTRRVFTGHTKAVLCILVREHGRRVFSGSDDGTIRHWATASGDCLQVFDGHCNSVTSLVLSPDRTSLLSGSADRTVRMWHVELPSLVECCVLVIRNLLDHDPSYADFLDTQDVPQNMRDLIHGVLPPKQSWVVAKVPHSDAFASYT